jgi:hypothetical protein
MQNKIPSKYGRLGVRNAINTETAYRHMFLDEFLKRDSVEEGRRLLRNIFIVRVVSELTHSAAAQALALVQSVEINDSTTYIPTGYEPL